MPTTQPTDGGCTFACNPADDCTCAAPIWSARLDPRVLVVRALGMRGDPEPAIDLAGLTTHAFRVATHEHVRIDLGLALLRLDVVEGTLLAGPTRIEPAVKLGGRLAHQLQAVRQLDAVLGGLSVVHERDRRLAMFVRALQVADALAAGESLRKIGLTLLGGDTWPGEGEYLKSRTRRLASLARALTSGGPAAVLDYSL